MPDPLKYAHVERERRFLVRAVPHGVQESVRIVDHYLDGTRLRLREVRQADGTTVRKLGHKVRLSAGPTEVACTSIYLDDAEWEILSGLPARHLSKTRHRVARDGWSFAVDEFDDGTLLAETDAGDGPRQHLPDWLDVIAEVTDDETWTGAGLAGRAQVSGE